MASATRRGVRGDHSGAGTARRHLRSRLPELSSGRRHDHHPRSGVPMRLRVPHLALCTAVLVAGTDVMAQTLVVAQLQVHGNTLTSADAIVRIAGVQEGEPFNEELLAA